MNRASVSRRTITVGPGAASLEIIASAVRGFYLRSLDLTLNAATASVYALGRPAAKGITPTTPVLFNLEASLDPTTASSSTAVAWATPPTVPTYFYRQDSLAAAVGAKISWVFANLWVPIGSSLVLWAVGTNSVADVNLSIDE